MRAASSARARPTRSQIEFGSVPPAGQEVELGLGHAGPPGRRGVEPQAEGTAADLADPYLDEGTGRVVELGTAEVARKGKEMAVGGGVGGVGVEAQGQR